MRVRRFFSTGLSIIVIIAQLALPLRQALASSPAMPEAEMPTTPRQPSSRRLLDRGPAVIPVNDEGAPSRSPPATPVTTPLSLTPAAPRQTLSVPLGTGNNNYGQTQRDTDNPQNHPGHHFAGSTNLVNGNFYLTAGDFFIPGRGLSLQLARSYNSLSVVPTTLLSETFEIFPPTDWDIVVHTGGCVWESTVSLGETNLTGGSGEAAVAHSALCDVPPIMNTDLRTFSLDLSRVSSATLTFRAAFDTAGGGQGIVDVSTDGGTGWDPPLFVYGASVPGHQEVIDLSAYAGLADVIVRFYYVASVGDGWWQVDDVQITGMHATNNYVGAFGAGWTHSYETRVITRTDGMTLTVREADGSLHDYSWTGPCPDTPAYACYQSPPGLYRQLRDQAGAGYLLWHKNGTLQVFGADGRFVEITDPNDNQINLYYYNAMGVCPPDPGLMGPPDELCWVDDPSGRRNLLFHYNMTSGFIEVVQERLNGVDGRSIGYSYDLDGNLIDVLYPEGAAHYDYDDQNRMVGYTDPRQPVGVRKTDEIVYDAQSRVITHTIDSFFDVYYEMQYDQPPQMGLEQGAVSAAIVTDGEGQQTLVEFDDYANVVYEGDWFPELSLWIGKWWWWHPVYWWLLWQRMDALGRITEYDYDPWGNTILAVNALGAPQAFVWEPPYYESLINAPDLTYGNILTATNGLGVSTYYDRLYDPAGWDAMWEIQAAGTTSQSVTFYGNDPHGQLLIQVDHADQSTEYGYDVFGNTTAITNAHGIVTYNEFDDVGRPHTTVDQAGYPTLYEYDDADRLLMVADARGGVTHYTYSEDGRDNLVELVNANGVTTTYIYDGLDRLISQTNSLSQTTSYEYDSSTVWSDAPTPTVASRPTSMTPRAA
jgi:YD repeat-containing protein